MTFFRCGIFPAIRVALLPFLILIAPSEAFANPVFEPLEAFAESNRSPKAGLTQDSDGNLYGTTYTGGRYNGGTVFKITPSGTETILHNFDTNDGRGPEAKLLLATNGDFYGTTSAGGTHNRGTVFRISPAGHLTTLHQFSDAEGRSPRAGLVQASDGNLYGTTMFGGASDGGTIFKMTPSGVLTTLHQFDNSFESSDGRNPDAELVQASDGNLYGITNRGGTNDSGTIYRISSAGVLTTVYRFGGAYGRFPKGKLVQASDGYLYGVAASTNSSFYTGLVFKFSLSGTLTPLHAFGGIEGYGLNTGLIQGRDGNLYGTTGSGGLNGKGTIFRVTLSGDRSTLHHFKDGEGSNSLGSLIQTSNGDTYGTTSQGGFFRSGTVFKILSSGEFTILHHFGKTDSSSSSAGLVQASDGNFYGATVRGGPNDAGTIFKITPSGTLSTLHTFDGSGDGEFPLVGLVEGSDGNLYGTTSGGGLNNAGTIFKITFSGILTTLHFFNESDDGGFPQASLVEASDGNFYGTTKRGGLGNAGTIFTITPTGALTTLHHFTNTDGYSPRGTLIQASDGALYGTTSRGGTNRSGTVFKITPAGTLTTLHHFEGADGLDPYGRLVQSADGDLFGTTYFGGSNRAGTIFKITRSGTLTTLHHFGALDGSYPYAGLFQAKDGFLYGTTASGGLYSAGTIFKVTTLGSLTTLHHFGGTDGRSPRSRVIQASDGNLYGTTYQGGTTSDGASGGGGQIYRLVFPSPELSVSISGSGSITAGTTSDFGHVDPGSGTSTITFDLTNNGNASLTLGTPAISGSEAADFTVDRDPAGVLEAGETVSFAVTFDPSAPGTRNAQISLPSDDPDFPSGFTWSLQGVGNNPPVWSGYLIATGQEDPATVRFAKLLSGASDPDGHAFSVTAAGPSSIKGGTVTLNADSITYLPPVGVSGNDSFTVTLTDELGGTIQTTVSVTIQPATGGPHSATRNPMRLKMTQGSAEVRFMGIPGRQYLIQRSPDMVNWSTIATVTAAANGDLYYLDPNPPAPSAYYRIAY